MPPRVLASGRGQKDISHLIKDILLTHPYARYKYIYKVIFNFISFAN